jgi:hypothetical protein
VFLSNPSLTEIAPFLKNAQTFKQHGLPILDVLTKISTELGPQIPFGNKIDLLNYCIKMYLEAVNRHFDNSMDLGWESDFRQFRSFHKMLTEYRLDMLCQMKEITNKYLEEINQRYHAYYKSYIDTFRNEI